MKIPKKRLIEAALKASKNAYAPYSHFKVGCAILCKNGKIITGVNVENSSYGLTICAERNAIAQAIKEGIREFDALVCVESKKGIITPCGACRQVLTEFNPELKVLIKKGGKESFINLSKLLPESFKL